MRRFSRLKRMRANSGPVAIVIACAALVASSTGIAEATHQAFSAASVKPRPYGLLKLGKNSKFPSKAIPTVARSRSADAVGDLKAADLQMTCDAITVDLDTFCMMTGTYPVPPEDLGKNNFFYATQVCNDIGGYLPSAAQLIGAAARVKLASTIDDNALTSSIDLDPTDGLSDRREMSSTLVTTQAGSSAAGAIGVSDGSTGNPRTGEPDPPTRPRVPAPETLQYVTVFDNRDNGGFGGSKAISQPENFRCMFNKHQGPPRGGEAPASGASR